MGNRCIRTCLAAALLLFSAATQPQVGAARPVRDTSFVDRGEGQEMVKDLLTRMPVKNSEVLGLLKIRGADGRITEVPIRWIVRLLNGAWEDRYETQPVAGLAGEVLIVKHRGLAPSEYLHGQYQNPGEEAVVQPVSGAGLYQPLAGSNFLLADLGLDFFHWPSQQIVKREMRRGRSCRVLESVHPNPPANGYSRVRSWIDFETGNLIMAEAYDASDRLLKEFSIRKISRESGKAKLKEIEMRNDQDDSRTRLEFNLEFDE